MSGNWGYIDKEGDMLCVRGPKYNGVSEDTLTGLVYSTELFSLVDSRKPFISLGLHSLMHHPGVLGVLCCGVHACKSQKTLLF